MTPETDLLVDLSHVLWIGGSTCSGKSSVADALGEKYGLPVYHYDRHERLHIGRMTPDSHPHYFKAISGTMDERWVLRSPKEMYMGILDSWTERFDLAVEDLLSIKGDRSVIAEGPGLFPELVSPLLDMQEQAIWLVASDSVIREVRATRPTAIREQTGDPNKAIENIIARDAMLAAHIREEARRLELKTLVVDWQRSLAETTNLIEQQFKPYLTVASRVR